jgi:hypothetical protein
MKTADNGYTADDHGAPKAEGTGERQRMVTAERMRQMAAAGLWGDASSKPVVIQLRIITPIPKPTNEAA